MSNKLSREKIDASLVSSNNKNTDSQSVKDTAVAIDLSLAEKDIVSEVGNISMSKAAATMSSLLNRQVKITSPRVVQCTLKEILQASGCPKVMSSIEFKGGLEGSNMLMIDMPDAIIIADLLRGNEEDNVSTREFTELGLNVIGEVMNKVMGSVSTTMSMMFDREIEAISPQIEVLNQETISICVDVNLEMPVVAVFYEMKIEGQISSQIIQLFSERTVREINDVMLNDTGVTLADRGLEQEQVKIDSFELSELLSNYEEDSDCENTLEAPKNLDSIMDLPLEFTVVLGKSRRTVKEILSLGSGSVVELDKMTDEPLEILVNGKQVAECKAVVINDNFGIRITNI